MYHGRWKGYPQQTEGSEIKRVEGEPGNASEFGADTATELVDTVVDHNPVTFAVVGKQGLEV
jgi:hypothetical protein